MSERTFIAHDGLRLSAAVWGPNDGRGAVLLHGGGQTRAAWDSTARALAERGLSVVAVDLRGHGASEWSKDAHYALEDFASDVALVARSFAEPPVLIGASLGGIAAMVAEVTEKVASALVLVDIATRLEPVGIGRIIGFMQARPDGFASLEDAADAVAAYLPGRPRPKDLSGLEKNLRRGEDGRYRWHWDPLFLKGPRPVQGSEELLTETARKLTIPTLLVRGKQSDVLSEEGAHSFLELVPHARYVDVANAGHMVAGDRNDAFTAAVTDFLGV